MLEFDFISFPKYFDNRTKMYETIYCVQWTEIIKERRLRISSMHEKLRISFYFLLEFDSLLEGSI